MASADDYRRAIIAVENKYGLPPGSIEALEVPVGFEVLETAAKEDRGSWFTKTWEKFRKGTSTDNYETPVPNNEATAAQGGGIVEDVTGWNFQKLLVDGTFIVLGVVVIALAVLSNKQVQSIAVTAVTKGRG